MMAESEKVTIYQLQCKEGVQHAVWDVEEAMRLRQEYGLLGDYVGTLPKHLSQNQFLSLPLFLNDDEVTYGLRRNFLHIVSDYSNDYPTPSKNSVEQFLNAFKEDVERQVEEAVIKQRSERELRQSTTMSRKRKRSETGLDSHPEQELEQKAGIVSEEQIEIQKSSIEAKGNPTEVPNRVDGQRDDTLDNENAGESEPARKIRRTGMFQRISNRMRTAFQSVFMFASPHLPSIEENAAKVDNHSETLAVRKDSAENKSEKNAEALYEQARLKVLDEKARHQATTSCLVMTSSIAREDEINSSARQPLNLNHVPVPHDMTHIQRWRRRRVFDDLKAKGYYLSCGAKFGADFLAYAGDPQLFHAALAVLVVHGNQALNAREIVALGRLGDATRKRTVLAWVDDEHDQHDEDVHRMHTVHYVGVQWEETLP